MKLQLGSAEGLGELWKIILKVKGIVRSLLHVHVPNLHEHGGFQYSDVQMPAQVKRNFV